MAEEILTEQHTTNPIQNILIEVESHALIFIAARLSKKKSPKINIQFEFWNLEHVCVLLVEKKILINFT